MDYFVKSKFLTATTQGEEVASEGREVTQELPFSGCGTETCYTLSGSEIDLFVKVPSGN